MIPKIIHYCWLSGDPMPDRVLDCIESWSKVLPDYKLMLWDKNQFDIHSVPWTDEAYECKKWAFAADYIRVYALYHYGGIYLDSDVRVIKSFDPFLNHRAFTGAEWWEKAYNNPAKKPGEGENIEAAIMGAEPGHPVIGNFLEYYNGRHFIKPDGVMDMLAMPLILSDLASKYGFQQNYKLYQVLEHDFHVYPYDYFTTQGGHEGDGTVTHNTVAIHLTTGSWMEPNPLPVRLRRHSRYTEWRLHTIKYFKNLWADVIVRRPIRFGQSKAL